MVSSLLNEQLLSAIQQSIHTGLYGSLDEQALVGAFPSAVDERLRRLVASIILAHAVEWREQSLTTMPSLPRLVDFDWRADIKTGSNLQSRMAVPTAIVELKVSSRMVFLSYSCTGATFSISQ